MIDGVPVLAVDGPSGSGKGTISRAVADRLGWHLLDSGALYRLTALASAEAKIDPANEAAVAKVARAMDVKFEVDAAGEEVVRLAGRDVTRELRSETTAGRASRVAAMPRVREALVDVQRSFRKPPGLVADGRDMGTVIFPNTPFKVFLTASAEARAERRYKQLSVKGIDVTLSRLFTEIEERDRRDATREVAPLRPADGARIVDTTSMTIDEVVAEVLEFLRGKGIAIPPTTE